MAKFVRNCEGCSKSDVFYDAAASILITHPSNWSQTKSSTRLVLVSADIKPGDENGSVMLRALRFISSAMTDDLILPAAEVLQGFICMVSYFQIFLEFSENDDLRDDDVDVVADAGIAIQYGHNIHDS